MYWESFQPKFFNTKIAPVLFAEYTRDSAYSSQTEIAQSITGWNSIPCNFPYSSKVRRVVLRVRASPVIVTGLLSLEQRLKYSSAKILIWAGWPNFWGDPTLCLTKSSILECRLDSDLSLGITSGFGLYFFLLGFTMNKGKHKGR